MSELLYQTLRESVVNAIRTKIMNHQIRPGERIVEMELAHEFQTSRGPIREALRQLENEGIVEYTRNVGCSVRTCFHEQLVLMSKLPRLAKAWKELYYGNLLAGYDLVREKEQILARQYDNHIAILNACKEGDPEKICREVKKHYWKTIFRMMQEQKIEDPNLEQAWMMAI